MSFVSGTTRTELTASRYRRVAARLNPLASGNDQRDGG
jgi:hypothetical protein